jgi:hypothetical protein
MDRLHLSYTTHEGGTLIEWPNIYQPRLEVIDEFSHGNGAYVQYPMENGIEHIHSFVWRDDTKWIIHRWDALNGWTEGGPE